MDADQTEIQVTTLPEMNVAYLRHTGPYEGDTALFARLFQQLFGWAGPRGLVGAETKVLSLYEGDPGAVEEGGLTVDAAITVPAGTAGEGEIATRSISGGEYAVGRFEILPEQYGEAWDLMMKEWLPESGYHIDAKPCLEVYINDPRTHPEGKHIVDICIPVSTA